MKYEYLVTGTGWAGAAEDTHAIRGKVPQGKGRQKGANQLTAVLGGD